MTPGKQSPDACRNAGPGDLQNKHGFASALRYILDHSEGELNEKEIQEYIRKEIKHVTEKWSVHFGQNYWNTATYAGNLRILIKSLAEQQGINIEEIDKELKEDKTVWWMRDSF